MLSPDASAPTRFCVQGTDVGRAEDRKSVLAKISRHDPDGLTAPTPRAPSTAAEGAWRIIRLW